MTKEQLKNKQQEALENLIKQSMEQNQNNQLIKDAIKGIDVNFDKSLKESSIGFCNKTSRLQFNLNSSKVEIDAKTIKDISLLFSAIIEMASVFLVATHLDEESAKKFTQAIYESHQLKTAA